jgi:hypothetical protein
MLREPEIVSMKTGNQTLNLQLNVFLPDQKIAVEETGEARVSTEASNNASAQVLRGEDLDALGDSPEDLADDLQRLAGPSAGPSGGQIFIDGFSGLRVRSRLRTIIGNITSPLFGQANQPAGSGGFGFSEAANNRRLELQTRFTF